MKRSSINRILVVGHKKLAMSNPMISFCAWENLLNLPDIADFDLVVIDLLTLPDSLEDVNWGAFATKFDVNAFHKVVLPGGHFVVIGDPRLSFPASVGRIRGTEPFLAWTGFEFEFESDEGRNIRRSGAYGHTFASRYLRKLQSYTWAYKSSDHFSQRDGQRVRKGEKRERLDKEVIAWSRSEHALALRLVLTLEVYRSEYGCGGSWRKSSSHGSIWLLPEINETPEETLRLILSDFYGLSLGDEEPGWLVEVILPHEEELRNSLAVVEEEIARLQGEQSELEAACAAARRPLRLVYDTGESLEDVTREVLAALGGYVSKPDVKGEEDGWVSIQVGDEVRHFVLEVKGVSGDHLGEEGLKQLPHWVQKGILEREIRPKGLLIGTAARNKPLNDRKPPFSDNFRKKAELSGFAVLRGIDLLVAYLRDLQGLLDRDLFWQLLWETNGIVNLSSAIADVPGADEVDTQALEQEVDSM
jgi:hypothetical protein